VYFFVDATKIIIIMMAKKARKKMKEMVMQEGH
jgi:hypothetical protein